MWLNDIVAIVAGVGVALYVTSVHGTPTWIGGILAFCTTYVLVTLLNK